MATTEFLTGARIPSDGDAPLGGTQISRAINDLANFTAPRFATTAARDSAFAQKSGVPVQGSLCVVGSRRYIYDGGWQTIAGYRGTGTTYPTDVVDGDTYYHNTYRCLRAYAGGIWRQATVTTVSSTADLTSYVSGLVAAGLTMGNGFQVFQTDNNAFYVGTGGNGLRLAAPQDWTNGSLDYPNSAFGNAWQGYQSFIWDTPLGAKVTIPADGVARTVMLNATANMSGDGYMRIRADVGSGAGTPSYWPNVNGKRSVTTGNTEQGISMLGRLKLDGSQQAVIYLEAKATTQGSMNMIIPQLMITAF